MNYQALVNQISQGLGYPDNGLLTPESIDLAIMAAMNAYCQWRPIRRRLGTGNLWAAPPNALASGQSALLVVGGVFLANSQVTIDPFLPTSEVVTVESASAYWPAYTPQPTAPITQLTLQSPTVNAHSDGALVTNATPGLNLVAGQDTYYLPLDWKQVDQASFDLVAGIKLTPIKGNGFYDASYEIARNLSGIGWGGASNYGPTSYFGLPTIATSFDPNGRPVPQGCGYTIWNWQDSGIPLLTMQPAPSVNSALDFFYYGLHTVATAPMADQEAIAAEARSWLILDQAGSLAGLADTETKAGKLTISATRKSLQEQAAVHHAIFEQRVVFRPYATSG